MKGPIYKRIGLYMEGGTAMACNFRISIHQEDKNLHLNLMGDFDGSSAWELINNLKSNRHGISRVYIHTDGLKHIHSFGRGIFQKNFSDTAIKSIPIIFAGEKASELELESEEATVLELGFGSLSHDSRDIIHERQ